MVSWWPFVGPQSNLENVHVSLCTPDSLLSPWAELLPVPSALSPCSTTTAEESHHRTDRVTPGILSLALSDTLLVHSCLWSRLLPPTGTVRPHQTGQSDWLISQLTHSHHLHK